MGKQGFVFSPSNMSSYQTCPRKFQAQSLTKEIQWKASKQKSRGTLIHNGLEKACKHGVQAVSTWPEGVDAGYVTQQVMDTRQQVASGAQMYIEHELTINDKFKPTGWWDEDAMLRAKADMLILPPMADQNLADVIDFKSGRIYDTEDFQLRVEALLVHLIYQRPIVNYAYWYVDQGQTVDGSIDFRNGLAPVQDIIDLMKEMRMTIRDGYFPPKKNKFCAWCDLTNTPGCNISTIPRRK